MNVFPDCLLITSVASQRVYRLLECLNVGVHLFDQTLLLAFAILLMLQFLVYRFVLSLNLGEVLVKLCFFYI